MEKEERYAKFLKNKRLEWDKESNIEHIQEEVKWAVAEIARGVWLSEGKGERTQRACGGME